MSRKCILMNGVEFEGEYKSGSYHVYKDNRLLFCEEDETHARRELSENFNEYAHKSTLESFINFCDDMMIAEEASLKETGKMIWDTLLRIFHKIAAWFKNLLLNINYFKNAVLSQQMNQDLLKILQISQARTEVIFKLIPTLYETLSLTKQHPNSETKIDGQPFMVAGDNVFVSRLTTFNDQIHKVSVDIEDNIDAAKDTDAYDRLMKNEYTDEKKPVPLSNIIPDMKKCNSNLATFENHLSKIKGSADKVDNNPSAIKLLNNMITCLKHMINYYNFRISILSEYFKAAKASLLGTVNNIKEKVNNENKSSTNFKGKQKLKIKIGYDQAKKIKSLHSDAISANTYSEYKPIFNELCKLLKLNDTTTIENLAVSGDSVVVLVVPENDNTIPLSKGQHLYHTSPNGSISQLEPRWKTPANVLFPTPRIYFHTNCPLDRWGNKADSDQGGNVYELKTPPSKVHIDRELGTTAVYVETDKPLPVEKIDYAKWKAIKNINLGLES